MSRFFSEKYNGLTPYTPGEQPTKMKYIKLNTNESPFPPSPAAREYTEKFTRSLNLYPDPTCAELTEKIAENCGVKAENVLLTNGSDEILNFAFMAFCDVGHPAVFADITYGFYPVFAELNSVPYTTIPLDDDFRLNPDDYCGINKTIFIANPNAPTGRALKPSEIEKILISNPDHVVVIDEAYVDFGGISCVPLINKYDNLLITQTFSKSRSMAGARLGFGIACKELIEDLNTVKYSTNPYNINSLTMAAALGTLSDPDYTRQNCEYICREREKTTESLRKLGFEVIDSEANFVFARHPNFDGKFIYENLKAKGVLVRHFTAERIADYNRITIGTEDQMNRLIVVLEEIIGGTS